MPVTLNGTYRVFEQNGYVKPGAAVDCYIHPAIETKGLPRAEANNLAEKVEEIIKTKLAELRTAENKK